MTALPLFADDRRAAGLLCLPVREFRRLVEVGALPRPVKIEKHERWDVEQIKAILSRTSQPPKDDFDL